ncbi:MAG: Hsp70 family protein [Cyanobacteria bacterium P01_F01_bin.143]
MHLSINIGNYSYSYSIIKELNVESTSDSIIHNYFFPTTIYLSDKGKLLVGQEAEKYRLENPDCYCCDFMPSLGTKKPWVLGERSFQTEEFIYEIIQKLKSDAETSIKQTINDVVITIPAIYDNHQNFLMSQAARDAGFISVGLLAEPIAAAHYYEFQNRNHQTVTEEEIYLVYDLGENSFDATLVQKKKSAFEIVFQSKRKYDLGGKLFSEVIYQNLVSRYHELLNGLPQKKDRESLRLKLDLKNWCQNIKHYLSEEIRYREYIGDREIYTISRQDFEAAITSHIKKTCDLCHKLIQDADLEQDQISQILMIGGSSSIPCIKQTLKKEFSIPIVTIDQPALTACFGAAIKETTTEEPLQPPPPSIPETEAWIEATVEKIKSSVFCLYDANNSNAVGTGFLVSDRGHILTCNHVVINKSIQVKSHNGDSWEAIVIGKEPSTNLAMLQIEKPESKSLFFANPITIEEGDRIIAFGYSSDNFTFSQGIINNRDFIDMGISQIQTDSPFYPGNSGGPIINKKGAVIGIINNNNSQDQELVYATAIRHIFAFAAQLRISVKRVAPR